MTTRTTPTSRRRAADVAQARRAPAKGAQGDSGETACPKCETGTPAASRLADDDAQVTREPGDATTVDGNAPARDVGRSARVPQPHRERIGGARWLTLAAVTALSAWLAVSGLDAYAAWQVASASRYDDGMTPGRALEAADGMDASGTVPVFLFWGDGCRHCAAEMSMLRELSEERPGEFAVLGIETWNDDGNAAARDAIERELGIDDDTVPLLIVGDRVFQGYDEDDPNDADIAAAIDEAYGSGERSARGMRLLGDAIAEGETNATG